MKDYKHKLYDFTPDTIFASIIATALFIIAVVALVMFIKTAHAINTYPAPDYLVSDDMASYMQKQGHGQEFEEGDMQ